MDEGNNARLRYHDCSILALSSAAMINWKRPEKDQHKQITPRKAYILNSLKHPDEVARLRDIYSNGFYLIGVYSGKDKRKQALMEYKSMDDEEAEKIMKRDEEEDAEYGQKTRKTFYLSDFFIHDDGTMRAKNSIKRIIDILFGHPYRTPTFDEFAMFMAFSSALRSADLSRQVGAVIANSNEEIIATGANDCPRFGGGVYWPRYVEKIKEDNVFDVIDEDCGRDYKIGFDSNNKEREEIIDEILRIAVQEMSQVNPKELNRFRNQLQNCRLKNITEYGRVVHAEMEALLSCSRNNISTRRATLYCTTFPCHNCAKHIIAAGIERVVYIEPYPKSKAEQFYKDSIVLGTKPVIKKVLFEPFVGVGPRKFFDLFSMGLSSGYPLERKKENGDIIKFDPKQAKLRIQMHPGSYIEKEKVATLLFEKYLTGDPYEKR